MKKFCSLILCCVLLCALHTARAQTVTPERLYRASVVTPPSADPQPAWALLLETSHDAQPGGEPAYLNIVARAGETAAEHWVVRNARTTEVLEPGAAISSFFRWTTWATRQAFF